MDGQPVGISARTLNGLDRAFKWTPGSAARTLAGGDPTPLSDEAGEFVSKLRHPSRAGRVVVDLDRGGDLVTVLTEILSSGELPPNAQEQLERLRDEAAIEEFPKIFEELSHNGKLRVAKFGQNVRLEELKKLSAERELEFMELPAHSEPDVPYRTPSVGQIHFSPTGEHHELTVAKRSLFTHYAEMWLFALDGVETISCFRAVIEGSGWLGVCRRRSGRARGRAECPGAVWTWRCCRS
ncbi:hypothetical protein LT350_33680 [Mycolicibacterium smegmatis]|uniref:hypothetical protein n=1 Tax=Mycolicibacterium smegmatis TaxID=1772 RepID=UPI001E4C3CFA|nr:hypothetical protein [Mycolicibacterium smegmatis]UGU31374.1 hypothetical protein LT350_33680 [Mycolicibacterium smegmatis]